MDKIHDIITHRFDSYTKSHRAVAGYISENYDESAFMTLEQLAAAAGVSTTTVVRFAKELGFEGYSEMQKALRSDLKAKAGLPERFDETSLDIPEDALLRKCMQTDIANIEQTFHANDISKLHEAIYMLSKPVNLYLLGMRRSYSLANYAFSHFGQIRRDVHIINATGLNYPEEILPAKKGDICLAFIFPRYSHTTLTQLAYLKNKGVRIILITSINHAAVDRYADLILCCETSSNSAKSSYAGPIALINYLTTAYMQNNKASSMEMLTETEQVLMDNMMLGF